MRYDDLVQFTELYKTVQKLLKAQKKKQEGMQDEEGEEGGGRGRERDVED